ncbi:hypothetical protein HZS_4343 [Henneguya salminicola]|uniref:Dihydroorotate dehydrogenase (quinone), mitochondrial n=1 Tax=Henneguya salminicola TaxID=69463 RepID=A0A6G3MGP5_HENSL|nr:hypothetical protein HZS_4343 [Henneguya salminicola]
MSAGFDKNGECIDGGFDIGFGFVELGTTIPQPQPGNNKPRLFRLTNDHALINRMGCNSEGFSALLNRIKKYRKKGGKNIVGVNIGINRDSSNPIGDYVQGIKTFSSYADYIAINISSPNTPGLRSFQEKDKLTKLLTKIKETTEELKYPKPLVFLKLSPDLSEAECLDIAKIVKDPKTSVDGLILTNTTIERPGSLTSSLRFELGGLSGRPLKDKSTKMIKLFYELTGGTIPIIGVGGIENGQDAFDKIASGASLVQLYTSFTYGGFGTINKIQRELHNILGDKGYKSVAEAVGSSCNNFVTPQ